MLYDNVVSVVIGLFCCLSKMGGGRHRRLRSATPEYELDAFEFFSIILGTSSKRQVYKRRDLPFTNLIMITLLFATSLQMGGGRHRRLRSATPEYELDAFEFFSIILGTSSKRQVYKRRDLPFTNLIMITLLFATSLLAPNYRGCLTLL